MSNIQSFYFWIEMGRTQLAAVFWELLTEEQKVSLPDSYINKMSEYSSKKPAKARIK
ncbi:hypothetical protein KNT87_gp151 [Erwinia phage Cronus]|uniref:Uncharacterized protein n=1 Tax=Erwinia phage Cronus TaxID=2163633 RepID=A0A2S1GM00_9CAUD|nr:hypothetical protein KNT87_gp151 [Erwinia phage Cronus]AWD90418.1 hypothetical protein [Erwinia phage Cronus]